jgi:hypothetical protein
MDCAGSSGTLKVLEVLELPGKMVMELGSLGSSGSFWNWRVYRQ